MNYDDMFQDIRNALDEQLYSVASQLLDELQEQIEQDLNNKKDLKNSKEVTQF